jgi:AraC-like DNA-binding protein/mannose-6-phosphate isomerase-like protein (cupin superfamily)
MKVEIELVRPDKESSFRLLHQNVSTKDFIWEYHYHPEIEITCVLNGTGTRHVGNHISSYEDGDLVLIGPDLPHSGFGLHATSPHEEIVIQVKEEVIRQPAQLKEMEAINQLLEKAKYGMAFRGETKKKVSNMLIEMTNAAAFERYIILLKVLHTLALSPEYKLLNDQVFLSSSIKNHKARLQKIFTYVENHYTEEIDISDISRRAGLSVPSFCNYFKKTTRMTFTDFVNRYRIQKACLLLHEDKTIAEASFACGFNNVTYFNKVFKSILNKTPSEYRKTR